MGIIMGKKSVFYNVVCLENKKYSYVFQNTFYIYKILN